MGAAQSVVTNCDLKNKGNDFEATFKARDLIDRLFKSMDSDQSGFISKGEFLQFLEFASLVFGTGSEVEGGWRIFGKDEATWQRVFDLTDTDKSGSISIREFATMWYLVYSPLCGGCRRIITDDTFLHCKECQICLQGYPYSVCGDCWRKSQNPGQHVLRAGPLTSFYTLAEVQEGLQSILDVYVMYRKREELDRSCSLQHL